MSFDPKNLVFSLVVKDSTTKKVVLNLSDGIEQPFEVGFDCGRTSGDPVHAYVTGEHALAQLKKALQDVLAKL